ncbi:MAG: bifunctional glutamate N-acetyltransferase/amino-acid acetyltransferase ArgJ [Candidatus Poribacteria bacterium]|nr:bifunctional glutamate N-acetyltransferase/amino-acid acetyltransferase ArgJ [Candidatus Poribacteria bacterium]
MKHIEGGITAVPGIRASGVHAGLKPDNQKDVALIAADAPAVAAGVFTKNRVCAPVVLACREHLNDQTAQAIVINSKNANACTGGLGLANARQMTALTGIALGIDPSLVLVASTGVIGVQLPMDKIDNGIRLAAGTLRPDNGHDAALAIMTTDTVPKEFAVEIEIAGKKARIGGMTKGAGMIAPHLATMLGFLMTDANISAEPLQTALREAVSKSFNRITVDSDSSTNDTVLILATGSAGNPIISNVDSEDYDQFQKGLDFACIELAKMIARDGEGATKLIEVIVKGAKDEVEGEMVARAIAESPLVKTAVFGADPNWGRILMAIGKSEAEFDPYQVDVWLNGYQLVKHGMDAGFDEEKATNLFARDTVAIDVDLNAGDAAVTMWTCDYSYDYIRINADYRT